MNAPSEQLVPPGTSRVRLRVVIALSGILLPVGMGVWSIPGQPEQIEISPETTVITEFTTFDGTRVNYLAWARNRFGTADPTLDPWHLILFPIAEAELTYPGTRSLLNGEIDSRKADVLQQRVELRRAVPFSRDDDPEFAAFVESNTDWYELVMSTDPGPPSVGGLAIGGRNAGPGSAANLTEILLPLASTHRTISRRLLEYAMFLWGQGERERALNVLAFVFKCRDREQQLPIVIDQMVASALDEQGCRALWNIMLSSDNLTDGELAQICAVRPDGCAAEMMREALQTEQLMALDIVQYCRHKRASNEILISLAGPAKGVQGNMFCSNVAWNDQLRAFNNMFDQLEELMVVKDYQRRQDRMNSVIDGYRGAAMADTSKTYSFEELYWLDANEYLRVKITEFIPLPGACGVLAQDSNHQQLIVLAALLHAWRRDHGEFPGTLKAVMGEDNGFRNEDAYTAQPLDYQRTEDGFQIRILGQDGKPDDPQSGRRSDDQIWAWPYRSQAN